MALYPGLDLREEALDRRIEELRKTDFSIKITGPDGSPVEGKVLYSLLRHEFKFGTALATHMLGAEEVRFGNKSIEITEEDRKNYQEIVRTYFFCRSDGKHHEMERDRRLFFMPMV